MNLNLWNDFNMKNSFTPEDLEKFQELMKKLSERYERDQKLSDLWIDGPKDDAYYRDLPKE